MLSHRSVHHSGGTSFFLRLRYLYDPATASAPFVATLVDVTGLVIYFTVAFLLTPAQYPSPRN